MTAQPKTSAAKKLAGRKPARAKLSPTQQRFVAEYLIDGNATQAYIRAGYKATEEAARRNAARLLTKADIQAAIDAGMAKTLGRLEITRERVLTELARIAFSDKRKLMTWGPNGVKLIDSAGLGDDDAAVVAEVSETVSATGGSLKLKTHDKTKALELLGRHLALFTDKTELSGPGGGPIETRSVHDLSDDELAAIAARGRG